MTVLDSHERRKLDKVIEDLKTCQDDVHVKLSTISDRMKAMSSDLLNHKNDVQALSVELQHIGDSLRSIKDVLEAWNNAKGFIVVMKFIAGTVKVLGILAVGVAVVGTAVMYIRGKMGI